MKNTCAVVSTILALFSNLLIAQEDRHAFHDALDINKDDANIKPVLEKYVNSDDPDRDSVIKLIENNHFLNLALEDKLDEIERLPVPEDRPTAQVAAAGAVNLISPTKAIDALGTFIAKRFRQELNIAYLNKFKEVLTQQTDLQKLFPTTHAFLLEADPFNYTTFLEALRAAFDEDLQNLLRNIPEVVKHSVPDSMKNDNYRAVLLVFVAINSISDNKPTAEVIADVVHDEQTAMLQNENVKKALLLLGFTIEEFTIKNGYDWISKRDLDQLRNNSKVRSLFVGLFIEKYRDDLKKLLNLDGDLDKLVTYIFEVKDLVEFFSSQSRSLKNQLEQTGKISVESFHQHAQFVTNIFERGVGLYGTITGVPDSSLVLQRIRQYSVAILSISRDIAERDYGKVFVKSLAFFGEVLPDSKFKDNFMLYGTFIVNVAVARSTDEMVRALETAALPVGSYRIKRNTRFNIALNSYFGVFSGNEHLLTHLDKGEFTGATDQFSIGFTAPVGIAFSWGKYKNNKEMDGSSKSIFLSVLDVAAVAAFRLRDKSSELPEFEFENVLAPGAYFVMGISKSPISFGFGAQYGPQLRKIDLEDGSQLDSRAWRGSLFVAVDIPIFNLHTRRE